LVIAITETLDKNVFGLVAAGVISVGVGACDAPLSIHDVRKFAICIMLSTNRVGGCGLIPPNAICHTVIGMKWPPFS